MSFPVFLHSHRLAMAAGAMLVLAFASGTPALAQESALGADVASLLAYARGSNPELAWMQAEAQAAQQRVQPAAALPDPVLRVERMNLRSDEQQPETRYTLMQMIPAWGKRGLREGVATADVQQAEARTAAAWTELAMRIKTAYTGYYAAAANERITREVLDLMQRVEQIAQARYAGGLTTQQDAIRAQLEQTAMRGELITLDAEKRQQRARLNALLARDAAAALAEPRQLRPLPDAAALDTAHLIERVRGANPAVRAEQARVLAAEKGRELTRRNRYPDVNVGVFPTRMNSRLASWGFMVELNIPLQQATRRSQEAEAQAMVEAARARVDNAAAQLSGDLGDSLAALDAARRLVALLDSQAMPQSQVGLRSAIAAYENGKVEFTALLDAQRQIRKVRLDRLKAEAEAQVRLAEIERIVGEEL